MFIYAFNPVSPIRKKKTNDDMLIFLEDCVG